MSKHTPGPWRARKDAYVVACDERETIICAPSASYKNPTVIADARLIAAAPDLLKELREVLDWATIEKAPLRDLEIESIRAVIAKAEGVKP